VDEADEHELINDTDCIECVKMIALTLHRKVHDRTLFDWSTAVDVDDVLEERG
jgi:hypothetical protein